MVGRHAERPPPLVILLPERRLEEGGEFLPRKVARVAEGVLNDPHGFSHPREESREGLHLVPGQNGGTCRLRELPLQLEVARTRDHAT